MSKLKLINKTIIVILLIYLILLTNAFNITFLNDGTYYLFGKANILFHLVVISFLTTFYLKKKYKISILIYLVLSLVTLFFLVVSFNEGLIGSIIHERIEVINFFYPSIIPLVLSLVFFSFIAFNVLKQLILLSKNYHIEIVKIGKEEKINIKKEIVEKQPVTVDTNVDTNVPKVYSLNQATIDLLSVNTESSNSEENNSNATLQMEILNEKFKELGVGASVERFIIGPSVTRYEVKTEYGVSVKKIPQIKDDLMMASSAKRIRIEAPIPGKALVGIELPNYTRSIVYLKNILQRSQENSSKLLVSFGLDIDNAPIQAEINKMMHLLIAGETGSGKSVCLNSMIISLLLRTSPGDLRLMIIDPKKVEMVLYNGLPHLLCPIINDPKIATRALERIVSEMQRRYDILHSHMVKNIDHYNALPNVTKLPYIVIFIDELADLMITSPKEIENIISRITQLARASGIHLVVATQRPSVNVITGIIKANIPSRIAFAVASQVDARTIYDESGAEDLLGSGDMLIKLAGDLSGMKRVQGAYVSDDDIKKVVDYIKSEYPLIYDENFLNLDKDEAVLRVLADCANYIKSMKFFDKKEIKSKYFLTEKQMEELTKELVKLEVISQNGKEYLYND